MDGVQGIPPRQRNHGGDGDDACVSIHSAQTDRPSGRLLDVPRPPVRTLPLPDSFGWFESAVGPLHEGATILLSGSPGSSKSTLTAELSLELALQGIKTLHIL